MFTNLQELRDRVTQMIQNERANRGLDTAVIAAGCETAVAIVSKLLPRQASDTLSGTGTATQFLLSSLDPAWIDELSYVVSVEYPVETTGAPTILDESEWTLYPQRIGATHLRFLAATPASAADNIRVVYTTTHRVTDTTSTWPDHLEPGVEHAAAAEACDLYAAKYGHSTNPAIDADSVNYGGMSRMWIDLAEHHRRSASQILGVDLTGAGGGGSGAGSSGARMTWADVDARPSPYRTLLYRRSSSR